MEEKLWIVWRGANCGNQSKNNPQKLKTNWALYTVLHGGVRGKQNDETEAEAISVYVELVSSCHYFISTDLKGRFDISIKRNIKKEKNISPVLPCAKYGMNYFLQMAQCTNPIGNPSLYLSEKGMMNDISTIRLPYTSQLSPADNTVGYSFTTDYQVKVDYSPN